MHGASKRSYPFDELVSPGFVNIGERNSGHTSRLGGTDFCETMHRVPQAFAVNADVGVACRK